MNPDAELQALARGVTPQAASQYATKSGWQRDPRGDALGVYLFRDPVSSLRQLQIPMQGQDDDFAAAILDVGVRLAEKEERPLLAVVSDMFFVGADVLRFRVVSREAEAGNISLDGGLNLLAGARQSILASACSVIHPARFHPRMSYGEAQRMLRATKLAQTEFGSYVVKIACPLGSIVSGTAAPTTSLPVTAALGVVAELATPGTDEVPFVRSATSLLLRSAGRLASAIDLDQTTDLATIESDVAISANFCEALEQMHASDEDAQLFITASWSGLLPGAPAVTPAAVELQPYQFPVIKKIAQRLRPNLDAGDRTFIATVDELRGDQLVDGRRAGEVILGIVHDGKPASARAMLNADFHAVADRAYMTGAKVEVRGYFRPGGRLHEIATVSAFEIVE